MGETLSLQVHSLLMLLFFTQLAAVAETKCDDSGLFSIFEEALVQDQEHLNELRHIFMTTENVAIDISVYAEVMNGSELINLCGYGEHYSGAFCSSGGDVWFLCTSYSWNYEEDTNGNIKDAIQWLSLLHGSVLSLFLPLYGMPNWELDYDFNPQEEDASIHLKIPTLKCNPSGATIKCILAEIITWIKVYAEAGGIPKTWDQNQRGSISTDNDYNDAVEVSFIWPMPEKELISIFLAEYFFVSLSLSLVIARFFPAVHNQIVSKVTRPEHQSLYWGTVIVSNIFTYGLLFLAIRVWSMTIQVTSAEVTSYFNTGMSVAYLSIPPIQQAIVHVILFIGAIIATLRGSPHQNNHYHVPISSSVAKFIILVSLCCSCCFLCCKCSHRCRFRTLKILVLHSLMSFVYHGIMEILSIAFMLFIEDTRSTVITLSLLCVSFLVFITFLVSFLLLNLFRNRGRDISFIFDCCGNMCGILIIFLAVILLVIVYMFVVISLNLKGVLGILTGLIPSVVLSAGSWYIKKRLQDKYMARNDTNAVETRDITVNDGNGDDQEEGEESADERQRLLH